MIRNIVAVACLLVISPILTGTVHTVKGKDGKIPNLLVNAHNAIISSQYVNIDSMIVYQNNKLINENYYGRFTENTKHRTHSTFKSINALIALIAIDQGLITTDELVMPLLNRYDLEHRVDPRKNRITVNNLLKMKTGISCDEAPGSKGPNHEDGVDSGATPLKYSLAIKMSSEPGSEFHYCNANSFLLAATVSAALDRAGRENIFLFADKYLMQPLGIKNYRFTRSSDGQFLNGQGNSYFVPKDLAKFGLLVLNKGKWLDTKIVSEQAIANLYNSHQLINWSFTDLLKEQPVKNTTYSHNWYKTTFDVQNSRIKVIHSWGNGGQFIFVVPSLEAVVVFTGSNQGNFRLQKQPFDIMHQYILPELMKSSLF